MMPSSQRRARRVVRRALVLVLVADRLLERLLVLGGPLPPRASMPSRRTVASTEAACSPPITEIRALGHIHRNRGS